VRIIKRSGNRLKVQGLEAVDGSPIIDIKPYTMTYCAVENAKVSEWMNKIQMAISQC